MTLRLEDPKLGTLNLGEAYGVAVEQFEVSHPTVRAQVVDRVAANGQDDTSRFYGSRAVTLSLHVTGDGAYTRRELLDLLRAFTSPSRRPYLYEDIDETGYERRILLRGNELGAPITLPGYAAVSVSWSAPEGVFESALVINRSVEASVVPDKGGRTYGKTYSYRYPAVPSTGSGEIMNRGTEPAPAVYRLYGPCTNPYVYNLDTGDRLTLKNLSLTADQFVEIDAAATTANLNGVALDNAYGYLDLTATDFGFIAPGTNRIRYSPDTYQAGAKLQVIYRHTWL